MILGKDIVAWREQSRLEADVPAHALHARIVSLATELLRVRGEEPERTGEGRLWPAPP